MGPRLAERNKKLQLTVLMSDGERERERETVGGRRERRERERERDAYGRTLDYPFKQSGRI